MIILKVTKNQGLTLSSEDKLFEKLQEGGVKLTPSPPPTSAVLGLKDIIKQNITGNYEIIQKNVRFVLYPRCETHT